MMTTYMEYKGYYGTVEVSLEDECLYGKIINTTDLILYEANSVKKLKKDFQRVVDRYIDKDIKK